MARELSLFQAVHPFDKDENEPTEMSIVEGEFLRLSPGEDGVLNTEDDAYYRDGWILVQSLRTNVVGYVPKVRLTSSQPLLVQRPCRHP
jgi:hypothetical protein